MAQYGFCFDSSRCTGCHTCEMACKDYHNLEQTETFRRVFDYEGGAIAAEGEGLTSSVFMYHVSAACNHCESPACLPACPAGAIEKDDDGIVFINQDQCAGAKLCIDACPYGVPIFIESTRKANKCDLCRDRLAEGLNPICVDACPLRALEFGDIEKLRKDHPDATDVIPPLADPAATKPSIVIVPCPAATSPDVASGAIANVSEVTGVVAFS